MAESVSSFDTAASLAALFKEVYAPELLNHVPDAAMLVKELKFSGVEATLGGQFVQPVVLSREHGFTYASSGDDAFELAGSIPMTVKRATLLGSQLVGQGRLGYEAAARASKGKAAFAEATELLVENMIESAAYRLEQMFLYGQTGLGLCEVAGAGATDPGKAGQPTFKVAAAGWAPTTWAGIEGAKITIVANSFTSAGGVRTYTGVKTVANTIVSVNMDESSADYRLVTLASNLAVNLAANDVIFFSAATSATATGAGATATVKECLGLDGILTTSTGDLFGIPVASAGAGTYPGSPLWKGNLYNVGGVLTLTHIMAAAKRARDKGLKESAKLLVSPKAWMGLVNPTMDPTAVSVVDSGGTKLSNAGSRKVDSSYSSKRLELGTESILIHGPQGANIEVVPHPYVREGDAFLVPFRVMKRVGASDIDFKTPGMPAEEMFIHLQNQAGYEFRCYANQALFVDAPAKCVKLYGITG